MMAVEEVEILLTVETPLSCESWRRMRGWYREALDHALLPAQVTLKRITAEREDLYRAVPPPPVILSSVVV